MGVDFHIDSLNLLCKWAIRVWNSLTRAKRFGSALLPNVRVVRSTGVAMGAGGGTGTGANNPTNGQFGPPSS